MRSVAVLMGVEGSVVHMTGVEHESAETKVSTCVESGVVVKCYTLRRSVNCVDGGCR